MFVRLLAVGLLLAAAHEGAQASARSSGSGSGAAVLGGTPSDSASETPVGDFGVGDANAQLDDDISVRIEPVLEEPGSQRPDAPAPENGGGGGGGDGVTLEAPQPPAAQANKQGFDDLVAVIAVCAVVFVVIFFVNSVRKCYAGPAERPASAFEEIYVSARARVPPFARNNHRCC